MFSYASGPGLGQAQGKVAWEASLGLGEIVEVIYYNCFGVTNSAFLNRLNRIFIWIYFIIRVSNTKMPHAKSRTGDIHTSMTKHPTLLYDAYAEMRNLVGWSNDPCLCKLQINPSVKTGAELQNKMEMTYQSCMLHCFPVCLMESREWNRERNKDEREINSELEIVRVKEIERMREREIRHWESQG